MVFYLLIFHVSSMSSPQDDGLPPIAVQKAIISASLNSTLLFLYLFGAQVLN